MRIRKAVFPVAGLGTRFLPATKASAKEMLPIVDKPLIQYAVNEAISAGAEELVFITSNNKNSILDHFDRSYELEHTLEQKGKTDTLRELREVLPIGVSCMYIRQPEAMGLGHAVLCAQPAVGDEDFSVILADDLIDGKLRPCLAQMQRVYAEYGTAVIAVQRVPPEETYKYGIVDVEPIGNGVSEIKGIVEKPKPEEAPSNLAVVGRYILPPRIFKILGSTGRGAGGEIQLTDAIAKMLEEQTVLAFEFEGTRFDCGSKLGYLQANVEFGLKHPEFADEFKSYLSDLTNTWDAKK
ncbi:UTP-glucose-1-phosphate uridylyltransferase [Oceanococcus atlanticus]|uniref:UTP--glucose-1-phosphate uridylyltransferase n=1 Tax=Oceanococcus atlanticus TaxID=1317117 RepID=A0A1Y1SD68_9GAMM|nr:UTP--glucose-1-phosphate uridylyltransferase GalU [Oceanococcus atlanticus]ORE86286.1 UTP-glucose-1-phosphate uridylyltransferase [Oceanococcus atlanticus]RZO83440.1 MAG: UTP--glucose-1-phosphate uridylyltransferase GalU [Oceanococcus sp.]